MLIEIIPNSWLKNSVFILNIYGSPRDRHQAFLSIIAKAVAKAKEAPLVVARDINVAHQAWGYVRHSPKGINLLHAVTNCSPELVTDPQFPMRIGNSVSRDTTPDMAFVKNATGVSWHNKHENLGSDHFIGEISVEVRAAPLRALSVVDWNAFRKRWKQDSEEYQCFEDLFNRLKEDVKAVTETVETELKSTGWMRIGAPCRGQKILTRQMANAEAQSEAA